MARGLYKQGAAASFDIGEVGRLLNDLAGPLARLAALVSANARAASNAVPDRLSEALSDIGVSFRDSALNMGGEATRLSRTTLRRVEDEVSHRPFVALAIAVGIGFLIGALNRR